MIFFLIAGLLVTFLGVLMFSGKMGWGKKTYRLGGVAVSGAVAGVLVFVAGFAIMLIYFINTLESKFPYTGF